MLIELYTADGCHLCENAKRILNEKGYAFVEHKIGVEYTKEQVAGMFPTVRYLPVVVINGKLEESTNLPQLLLEG